MEDIRGGICPLCHARGIVEGRSQYLVTGTSFKLVTYACRSCGFAQNFSENVREIVISEAEGTRLIGGDDAPFR